MVILSDLILTGKFCCLNFFLLKKVPLFTRYSIYTLQTNSNFSNDKAHKELNFRNRKIEDSIKDTIIDITKKEI